MASTSARNRPKTPIENVPDRPGFVRRWVSSREFDYYEEGGFSTVKDGVKKNRINDPVVDDLVLMELPLDKAKEFHRAYQGGEEHERLMRQVQGKKSVRDSDDDEGRGSKSEVGIEGVDIEVTTLPPDLQRIRNNAAKSRTRR